MNRIAPIEPSQPQGLLDQIHQAESALKILYEEMSLWEKRARVRTAVLWVRFHDEHGWPPGEEDYEKRLRREVRNSGAHV